MKTLPTLTILAACSFACTLAPAQSFQFGFGSGNVQVQGSIGRPSGGHPRMRTAPIRTTPVVHHSGPITNIDYPAPGVWSEWRPVEPAMTHPAVFGSPRPRMHTLPRQISTPIQSVPQHDPLLHLLNSGGGVSSPISQRPAITPAALMGTWKASDRAVRMTAGNRFTVAWQHDGTQSVSTGTYRIQGNTILFQSDEGDLWPWTIVHMAGGRLVMSHREVGQRTFQRVNR